jgi:putative membrane protein
LISFGFTIYKLLQGFHAAGEALPREDSPRNIGLFLTALGTLSMVLGAFEYVNVIKEMRRHQHFRYIRPAFIVALLISVAGSLHVLRHLPESALSAPAPPATWTS